MVNPSPEIIEVNSQQLEELLARARGKLDEADARLIEQLVESYRFIAELLEDKKITIDRLQKLLFGAQTEKTQNLVGDANDAEETETPPSDDTSDEHTETNDNAATDNAATDEPSDEATDDDTSEPRPGHGRYGADDYAGAEQVEVEHPTLEAGDTCPECQQGTLYEKTPGVIVRFVGQAPLQGTVYRLQRFRCHLCGKVFTAPAPPDAGPQKYDHTVASMIGLLKYGSGLPFNRLQRLQGACELPLAASTQWQIVSAAALLLAPAYEELIRQAAQGDVVHNDDTTIKILELMGERAQKSPPADDEHDPDRTGLFTSGVVSTREGVHMALFFSGRQHAGESLADVLDDLQAWLQRQLDERQVEPNSALGGAINYLLKRWDALTLFLRKAGAPLDNNICERALKKAILHRKNSLFFLTRKGACVGDIYMSLIYTCEMNHVNALDYLNQLQLHAADVAEHPDRWMPWNYRDQLAATPQAA